MSAREVIRCRPPFPYYGCKQTVAEAVWDRLGPVRCYVEPFGGSAAVLLGRPTPPGLEILGDACGLVSNFWRAVKIAPAEVARHAHFPSSQIDLHARHGRIARRAVELGLPEKLRADPEWCDPKLAAWWAWGRGLWIGGGWGNGRGEARPNVYGGRGVHRKFTTAADYLGDLMRRVEGGQPSSWEEGLGRYFAALAHRLERVTLLHGDWRDFVKPGILNCGRDGGHPSGFFLDPPYDLGMRYKKLYAHDRPRLSKEVWKWSVEHGDDPRLRIALCGLEGEHRMPPAWEVVAWTNRGGAAGKKGEERIWFSPHCLRGRGTNAPTSPNAGEK